MFCPLELSVNVSDAAQEIDRLKIPKNQDDHQRLTRFFPWRDIHFINNKMVKLRTEDKIY